MNVHIYKFSINFADRDYEDLKPVYWSVEYEGNFRKKGIPPHDWTQSVIDLIYQTILAMGYIQADYKDKSALMIPAMMLGEVRIKYEGEIFKPLHMHLKLSQQNDEISVSEDTDIPHAGENS